jgi:hypothetical protein
MSEHTEQQQGFVDAHVNAERLYNLQTEQSKAVLASVASMQMWALRCLRRTDRKSEKGEQRWPI